MCQFASFVLTKEKAYWLPDSESHSEIIQQHKIHEGGGRGLNVVKVELVPQKGAAIKDGKPTGEWKCIFDQDQFPDWHDAAKDERRARHALAAKITNLTTLYARYSKIVDVSALTNLTTLYANWSQIVDVSALTNLTTLDARGSKIVDVSALTNLTTLYARYSQIVDVSALTNLTTLDARYSKIPASQLAKLRRRGCTVY